MSLHRSDCDQAARYLRYACELLGRQAFGKTVTLRHVLQMAERRLSAGDHYVGDAAAEITVLRQVADKVPIAEARTEILEAIAVLNDRGGR
jgi:3-deoxy-D-manno-octulosonate 8-phosphate phosphatase KdsC-like HAD superfamily phosphatase